MNEDDKILKEIRSAVTVIARQIKRDKGCGGDKLNAFGRLINAYNRLSQQAKEKTAGPESYFEIPKRIKIKKKPDA